VSGSGEDGDVGVWIIVHDRKSGSEKKRGEENTG
jgi:hypothetical protein